MPPRRIFSKLTNTRSINRKGRRTIYLVFFFFTRIIHLDSSNLSHSRSRKERFLTLFRSFLASRSSLETFLFVFSSLEKSPLVYSSQLLHVVSGCGKIRACFIGDVLRIEDTCEGKWVGIHPISCNIIQGDDASLDIEYRKYLIRSDTHGLGYAWTLGGRYLVS